jgi:hypothetical protein
VKLSLDIDTEAADAILDLEDRPFLDQYLRGEITGEALMKERGWNDREFCGLLRILVDAAVKSRAGRKRRVGLD